MKILITGASGQLGIALCNLLKQNHTIYAYDLPEMDITDIDAIFEIITSDKPDVIINCAAYTKVDLCEENIEKAYCVNAIGAKNLAIAAEKFNVKLVQISTDYVFEGNATTPVKEDEPVGPCSIYGKSKLMAEEYVKELSSKHYILRTAWLYGEGENFVRTMLLLSKNQSSIKVVNDQFGSPTSTKELSKLIAALITTEHYGVYHATCEGQCSWYEFAKKIFDILQIDIDVQAVTSDEFIRPAKRPTYSVLDNFMLKLIGMNTFQPWEEALEEYLLEDREWQNSNL